MARRVSLSIVCGYVCLANEERALDVYVVSAQDVSDGGHDLPSFTHAVEDLVRGRLVRLLTKERCVSARLAAGARVRFLRDSVGVDAQAAPGDGPPRP